MVEQPQEYGSRHLVSSQEWKRSLNWHAIRCLRRLTCSIGSPGDLCQTGWVGQAAAAVSSRPVLLSSLASHFLPFIVSFFMTCSSNANTCSSIAHAFLQLPCFSLLMIMSVYSAFYLTLLPDDCRSFLILSLFHPPCQKFSANSNCPHPPSLEKLFFFFSFSPSMSCLH